MRNRSHDCVCIFALALLFEILLAAICHAEIINVVPRTKREVSVETITQSRENGNYDAKETREMNLKHEKSNGNLEENDTFFRRKREVTKASLNPVNNDFQRPSIEKSINDNFNSRGSNEKADYAEEVEDEETGGNLVRLARSTDLKYTDQDERSSLYDDYEAKDVAKRGAEDYEEVEEDSPEVSEDTVAVREEESTADEAERRENSDSRVKRNQATSESLDNVKSSDLLESEDGTASELRLDPGSLGESKIAANGPSSHEVSNIESSRRIEEPSLSNNGAFNNLGESALNEVVSSPSSASAEDTNAEYEKRAQERIQQRIDSIKDEIRRDIEAQRRIRDIQENNAKFDELQDEDSQSFEESSIEKRQSVAKKRSIRDVDAVVSPKNVDKKQSLKRELRGNLQRRSIETGKSDNSSKKRSLREKPKRQSANSRDESSGQNLSKGLFKKKRERVRETILVKKDRAKKRHSRSYALTSDGSDGKSDFNSYLRANDGTVQVPLQLVNEDESNEEGQSSARRADSLVSFTGSSQELSPRLAKEYKEAFGGLQSESGNALARFKRVKRVLTGPNAKI